MIFFFFFPIRADDKIPQYSVVCFFTSSSDHPAKMGEIDVISMVFMINMG
jgi:hypothetical protein